MKRETIHKRINQLNNIFDTEYRWKLISWANSAQPYNRKIDLVVTNADYIAEKIEYYEEILNRMVLA